MTVLLRSRRVFTRGVLVSQAILLVILGVLAIVFVDEAGGGALLLEASQHPTAAARWIAIGISFVAGAQGNAFHKSNGMLYGNVAVTFVVQMAFNFLTQSVFRRIGINGEPNLEWAGIFFVLLGFAGGGAIGFALDHFVLDGMSIFLPALIALFIAFVSLRFSPGSVDPTPRGSFA